MSGKNEDKEQEAPPKPRICPFLNEECRQDACSLYMRIQSPQLGFGKPIGACAFIAQALILSTLGKGAPPPRAPGLQLPGIRG